MMLALKLCVGFILQQCVQKPGCAFTTHWVFCMSRATSLHQPHTLSHYRAKVTPWLVCWVSNIHTIWPSFTLSVYFSVHTHTRLQYERAEKYNRKWHFFLHIYGHTQTHDSEYRVARNSCTSWSFEEEFLICFCGCSWHNTVDFVRYFKQ